MRSRTIPPVVFLALSLALGCSQALRGNGAVGTTTTAPPPRDVAVETKEGQVTMSFDGQLPPGWPESFPVPPGAVPAGSGSVIGPERGLTVGVYRGSGDAEAAFEFYRTTPDLQVANPASVGVGRALVGRVELTGPYDGSVTVGGNAGSDLIVVLLRLAPDASG